MAATTASYAAWPARASSMPGRTSSTSSEPQAMQGITSADGSAASGESISTTFKPVCHRSTARRIISGMAHDQRPAPLVDHRLASMPRR